MRSPPGEHCCSSNKAPRIAAESPWAVPGVLPGQSSCFGSVAEAPRETTSTKQGACRGTRAAGGATSTPSINPSGSDNPFRTPCQQLPPREGKSSPKSQKGDSTEHPQGCNHTLGFKTPAQVLLPADLGTPWTKKLSLEESRAEGSPGWASLPCWGALRQHLAPQNAAGGGCRLRKERLSRGKEPHVPGTASPAATEPGRLLMRPHLRRRRPAMTKRLKPRGRGQGSGSHRGGPSPAGKGRRALDPTRG